MLISPGRPALRTARFMAAQVPVVTVPRVTVPVATEPATTDGSPLAELGDPVAQRGIRRTREIEAFAAAMGVDADDLSVEVEDRSAR